MSDISLQQPYKKSDLEFKKYFKIAITEQWPFVVFCVLYALFASFYLISNDYTNTIEVVISIMRWFCLNFIIFGSATLSIYAVKYLVINRPKGSPTKALWRDLRKDTFSNSNLPKLLTATVGLSLVMSIFVTFKASIPMIKPFAYDAYYAELDAWLHVGHQPWQLLQNIIPFEWMTWIIHRNYYFWFPVIFITYFWQSGATKDPALRRQFLLTYVVCWVVIGNLLALAMSSAGPIYYDRVVGDGSGVYLAAEQYLRSMHDNSPLYMFHIKEELWSNYQNIGENGLVKGISAMPSMHVSIAFLLMLFGFQKGKLATVFYSVFGILIMVGSVHLLWHYAIDGYVSIIATYLIWKICGWVTQKTAEPYENIGSA